MWQCHRPCGYAYLLQAPGTIFPWILVPYGKEIAHWGRRLGSELNSAGRWLLEQEQETGGQQSPDIIEVMIQTCLLNRNAGPVAGVDILLLRIGWPEMWVGYLFLPEFKTFPQPLSFPGTQHPSCLTAGEMSLVGYTLSLPSPHLDTHRSIVLVQLDPSLIVRGM